MDAKLRNLAVCFTICLLCQTARSATFQTANFVVTAPSTEIAEKVGRCAEVWREDLALMWLGQTLPNWYKPCPISVKVGQIGAGGSTTFTFDNGEVFGWNMKVQGTLERILDSVIPHEINHTIFASYFRRPLPRWADEGAATLFEHRSEQQRQLDTLNRVMKTSRRIELQELLTIREYPEQMEDVLTLYAEGYSLATFLVGQKGERGKTVYLNFLEEAFRSDWNSAIRKHYGFENISSLEREWTNWVMAGSPDLNLPAETVVAAVTKSEVNVAGNEDESVIRFQSPDSPQPLAMIPRKLRNTPAKPNPQAIQAGRQPDLQGTTDVHSPPARKATSPKQDGRTSRIDASLTAPTLSRESLSPTTDGLANQVTGRAYQFPKMRAF